MVQSTRLDQSFAGEHDTVSDFYDALTLPLLQQAGIKPGMRVLDIGCGTGGATRLAAQLVGPTGLVVGVDRAAEVIAQAMRETMVAGLGHVRFVTQELSHFAPDEAFDALIGTRVLLYFTDPAVILRRLVGYVRPGGVIALQEYDLDGATSEPVSTLYAQTLARVRQTLVRSGADVRVGLKLAQICEDAGLPAPKMMQMAHVEKGQDATIYAEIAQMTRALLPVMMRVGVATAQEVGIETLAARMREDALMHDATLVSPPLIGAWTRKQDE